jgi:hypothetical protein
MKALEGALEKKPAGRNKSTGALAILKSWPICDRG